ALGRDIDFTGYATTVLEASTFKVKTNLIQTFSGVLDGFGHAVLNVNMALVSTGSTPENAALIQTNTGTIRNFGIVGGSFSTNSGNAASLAMVNRGTITNSFSTASVSSQGNGDAGGLVTS